MAKFFNNPMGPNTCFMPNPNFINQNMANNLNPALVGQGNFNTVFNQSPNIQTNGYDPKGLFCNHNFMNRGDLLNNNLKSIILNEEIREYSVMIDSKDRNYQVYPDPFTYEVKFNPLPSSREKINGKIVVHQEPAPTINDNFTNVRYIKLESVILPFYNKIKMVEDLDDDGDPIGIFPKVDTYHPLTDDLYTVLSLGGEYSDPNYRSTNDVLADSFATIYYDSKISNTHFIGYTGNGTKIFPLDQLAKIDKLKISFMDPYGEPLRCRHVDKRIQSNLICTCDDPEGDDDTDCFKHNIYHPLNPIFQHHLHFKIGVIEPRLNKKIFS